MLEIVECLKKLSTHPASYLSLMPDKKIYTDSAALGYISYKDACSAVVIFGNPIYELDSNTALLENFKSYCASNGWHLICSFASTEQGRKYFENAGFRSLLIGYEPVVKLANFNLKGKKMSNVRHSINHAKKSGIRIEESHQAEIKKYLAELHAISNEWLSSKQTSELCFAIGVIPAPELLSKDARYFIAFSKNGNTIEAFLIYYPCLNNSYYLDISRRRLNAPNGIMELLITESFKQFACENVNNVYLGLAPFSYLTLEDNRANPILNLGMMLFNNYLNFIYPTKSELLFKSKFNPDYEKRYLCYFPVFSLKMIYALFKILLPSGINGIVMHKLKFFKLRTLRKWHL